MIKGKAVVPESHDMPISKDGYTHLSVMPHPAIAESRFIKIPANCDLLYKILSDLFINSIFYIFSELTENIQEFQSFQIMS